VYFNISPFRIQSAPQPKKLEPRALFDICKRNKVGIERVGRGRVRDEETIAAYRRRFDVEHLVERVGHADAMGADGSGRRVGGEDRTCHDIDGALARLVERPRIPPINAV